MADDMSGAPEAEDEPYEHILIKELRNLPPGEKVSDADMALRHGTPDYIWLDAALTVMGRGEPVLIEESPEVRGWRFCLAKSPAELEPTRARVVDQYLRMSKALRGINLAQIQLVTEDIRGCMPSTN